MGILVVSNSCIISTNLHLEVSRDVYRNISGKLWMLVPFHLTLVLNLLVMLKKYNDEINMQWGE